MTKAAQAQYEEDLIKGFFLRGRIYNKLRKIYIAKQGYFNKGNKFIKEFEGYLEKKYSD